MPRITHKNKKYSAELKKQAVQSYLRGEGSLRKICEQYKILDNRQLRNWIKWYNGHREFKERSSAEGEIYMTKGCRTDFADIQNKKECGGNRQWQRQFLRKWAANTKGKAIT